jgi:hypothetical protein
MKKIIGIIACGLFAFTATANNDKDTTKLKFGDLKILIIEEESADSIQDGIHIDSSGEHISAGHTFGENELGHWAGIDIGINGFLTHDNSFDLDSASSFLDLDYAKSISLNLNLFEWHLKLVNDNIGITTGLGLQWNRYAFKKNIVLSYDNEYVYGVEDTVISYDKNYLKTTYLQVPLLVEINLGNNKKRPFHIGGGVIGGYRIGSRVKQKYEFEGDKIKNKTRGSYNFNPIQLYSTVRVGIGNVHLFANYGLTRVFEKDKGPQLYPFTVGLTLVGF